VPPVFPGAADLLVELLDDGAENDFEPEDDLDPELLTAAKHTVLRKTNSNVNTIIFLTEIFTPPYELSHLLEKHK